MEGNLHKEKRYVSVHIMDEGVTLYNEHTSEYKDYDPTPVFQKNFKVKKYGRIWDINIRNTKSFSSKTSKMQPIMILAGGLIIDSLLFAIFILLARANRNTIQFADMMADKYQKKANDLGVLNLELEEFAYRTSHDLRSPLVSSIGLLDVIDKQIQTSEHDKACSSLSVVKKSLCKLETLIHDILELTKIKNYEKEKKNVCINNIINSSIEKFSHLENFNRIDFQKNLNFHFKISNYCRAVITNNIVRGKTKI